MVLILLLSAVLLCSADPIAVLQRGRLLAASMDYNVRVEMFSISANGTVKKLWNVTSAQAPHHNDDLFSTCYFAFDPLRQSIYVSTEKYLQAINVHTGKITQTPNVNYPYSFFVTLDYDPTNRTLYGVCTGNSRFDWCEWQIETNPARNSTAGGIIFKFGLDSEIILGPDDCIGDYVPEEDLFFYEDGGAESFAHAINTTSGKEVYFGLSNGSCLNYDSIGRKLYAVVQTSLADKQYSLFVVNGDGKTEQKKVFDFPYGLALAGIGTCVIVRKERTLFVPTANTDKPDTDTAPRVLFGVDLVTMDVVKIPVPEFAKELGPAKFVTHMMYVPNEMWMH